MALVRPAAARATILNTLNGALVTIPSARNTLLGIFLGAWLCFWTLGGLAALKNVLFTAMPLFARLFLFFWLVGWAIGWFFVSRTLWTMFFGKETISITPSALTITAPGRWVTRSCTYAAADIRRLRVEMPPALPYGRLFVQRFGPWAAGAGTLRFDHGMGTVTFAAGIDEPEAQHILAVLREKGPTIA